MGSLLDCVKGADRRQGSPSRVKSRSRHSSVGRQNILSSAPQWLPPSPAFPVTRVAYGVSSENTHYLATMCGGNHSFATNSEPENPLQHPPSPKHPANPLVSTAGPKDYNSGPFTTNPNSEGETIPCQPLPASDWSLYAEGECMFRKPKSARKLLFSDPSSESSSEHRILPPNGRRTSNQRSCEVDVNYANVHELCVVGFTREQAGNVVAYRVGRRQHFQNKGELKAVPGIDEETWQRVKSRITLVPAALGTTEETHQSRSSEALSHPYGLGGTVQRTSVPQAVGTAESAVVGQSRSVRKITIDLNSCNVQGLCVIGFNHAEASAVIEHRIMMGGYFQSKEDVKMVPGISGDTYMRVQSKLVLGPPKIRSNSNSGRWKQKQEAASLVLNPSPVLSPLSAIPPALGVGGNQLQETVPFYHPWPHSAQERGETVTPFQHHGGVSLRSLAPEGDWQDGNALGALFAEQDSRFRIPGVAGSPVPGGLHVGVKLSSPRFSGGRSSGGTSLRIASWNLQVFNEEKASRPGVLEVVCTTIVQHG